MEAGQARAIPFDLTRFDMPMGLTASGGLTGYSGFRLLAPINQPDVWDEIGAFQGASYFRSLGRDQVYGSSARGLAIGTGEPGEEFPDFVAWRLKRPEPGAPQVVVHGLLDGPSCAGAYRFAITPGANTVFEVSARLYPRQTIDKAGVAPASSMFLFDMADPSDGDDRARDFCSGVHDSDGLAIWTGDGRRIWRPLTNPRTLRMSQFPDRDPRGFGLMQRKRDFESYGDLEARYDRRPSLWVEPITPFGMGSIYLLEMATRLETDDNIACFWRPSTPWGAGEAVSLDYRLHFGTEPYPSRLARVVRTRTGRSGDQALFGVYFEAPSLEAAHLRAVVQASAGDVLWSNVVAHADPCVVRATFAFKPDGEANLALSLFGADAPQSEIWMARFEG